MIMIMINIYGLCNYVNGFVYFEINLPKSVEHDVGLLLTIKIERYYI